METVGQKGAEMKVIFKQEAIITSKHGERKGYADCQITSDSRGKTLSLLADGVQITVALEPILERLKSK